MTNVINLAARDHADRELVILSAALHDRCLAGADAHNAAAIIQLAERICATAQGAQ